MVWTGALRLFVNVYININFLHLCTFKTPIYNKFYLLVDFISSTISFIAISTPIVLSSKYLLS